MTVAHTPAATGTDRRWRAARRSWRALGTYVQLAVEDSAAADLAEHVVRGVLEHVDATCSRFRPDSDLVRANESAGRTVDVDPLLVRAVDAALEAAAETDGLVDPTLGLALAAVGYDRDVSVLAGRDIGPVGVPRPPPPRAWTGVETEPGGRLHVPHGVALDLGATGKAFASDLAAQRAAEATGTSVLLSLGGDVAVGGPTDDEAAWPVGVQETESGDGELCETVLLPHGGLATSSSLARSWRTAGRAQHHLLDPRTGRPVPAAWRTVTATGATCLAANTATTAAMVLGADAVDWLVGHDVPARLVRADGRVERVGRWPAPLTHGGAA